MNAVGRGDKSVGHASKSLAGDHQGRVGAKLGGGAQREGDETRSRQRNDGHPAHLAAAAAGEDGGREGFTIGVDFPHAQLCA